MPPRVARRRVRPSRSGWRSRAQPRRSGPAPLPRAGRSSRLFSSPTRDPEQLPPPPGRRRFDDVPRLGSMTWVQGHDWRRRERGVRICKRQRRFENRAPEVWRISARVSLRGVDGRIDIGLVPPRLRPTPTKAGALSHVRRATVTGRTTATLVRPSETPDDRAHARG